MKVALIKGPTGYQPDSQHDMDALSEVKVGDVIYGDFKQPRNPRFHRLAFATLQTIFDNQDQFESFDDFYRWLKVAAGCVEGVIGPDGTFYVIKSLSFADMDESEFHQVFEKFKTVAYEKLGMEWVLSI